MATSADWMNRCRWWQGAPRPRWLLQAPLFGGHGCWQAPAVHRAPCNSQSLQPAWCKGVVLHRCSVKIPTVQWGQISRTFAWKLLELKSSRGSRKRTRRVAVRQAAPARGTAGFRTEGSLSLRAPSGDRSSGLSCAVCCGPASASPPPAGNALRCFLSP